MNKIPFNKPPYVSKSFEYMRHAIEENEEICGDGEFSKKCALWFEDHFNSPKVLLTTSGTTALDMAAILCGIQPGDEVILSSFTFSSTATAFVMRGARLVFVDIRPDTMNIDENKIEAAITDKTKAIVVTHYAGVACEMDTIMAIAHKYHLKVVEDAAHAPMATYKGKQLGTIGDFGCFSFHETKNYSMGEGGAISINKEEYIKRSEIIREKGTNRTAFYRGEVAKYNWVDIGDSFLPSDLLAAYLYAQLEVAEDINNKRLSVWNAYDKALRRYDESGRIQCPVIPEGCVHNAHIYYIKLRDIEDRSAFISEMKKKGISCTFHYVPLHSAPAGQKYGRFCGEDVYTTKESDRLVRLPMFMQLTDDEVDYIIHSVTEYLIR